jgi:hypothetical protein
LGAAVVVVVFLAVVEVTAAVVEVTASVVVGASVVVVGALVVGADDVSTAPMGADATMVCGSPVPPLGTRAAIIAGRRMAASKALKR